MLIEQKIKNKLALTTVQKDRESKRAQNSAPQGPSLPWLLAILMWIYEPYVIKRCVTVPNQLGSGQYRTITIGPTGAEEAPSLELLEGVSFLHMLGHTLSQAFRFMLELRQGWRAFPQPFNSILPPWLKGKRLAADIISTFIGLTNLAMFMTYTLVPTELTSSQIKGIVLMYLEVFARQFGYQLFVTKSVSRSADKEASTFNSNKPNSVWKSLQFALATELPHWVVAYYTYAQAREVLTPTGANVVKIVAVLYAVARVLQALSVWAIKELVDRCDELRVEEPEPEVVPEPEPVVV